MNFRHVTLPSGEAGVHYRGPIYRALNPLYAREPLSGRGASLYGGRFNRRGTEALYTSLAPDTAMYEATQVGTFQPITLVAYRADVGPVFDSRDTKALAARGLTPDGLADPEWRVRMNAGWPVPTQEFAAGLIADGYAGLLVCSFAAGAGIDRFNLVLWRWNTGAADRLDLVDDEDRLARS